MRQGIARGCETYIIREGWEGLVRGNNTEPTPAATPFSPKSPVLAPTKSVSFSALPPSQQLKLESAARDQNQDEQDEHRTRVNYTDPDAIAPLSDAPLSFGYGEMLKDGAGEGDLDELAALGGPSMDSVHTEEQTGKTLKGRYIVRVGWDDVRGWLGEGGTLIGSSRCPSCEWICARQYCARLGADHQVRERDGRLRAAHNLIKHGIDCLAVCGGDGSLTGADKLRGEWPSLVDELYKQGG